MTSLLEPRNTIVNAVIVIQGMTIRFLMPFLALYTQDRDAAMDIVEDVLTRETLLF